MTLNASLARRSTAALPLATSPPALVAVAGHLIHVVAMDASNQRAVHAALDRDGALVSAIATLPISLASARACGDQVVATGIHVEKGVRWALALDAEGNIGWQTPLNIPTAGLVWVVPTCIAAEPAIVWEVEHGQTGELGVASITGGSVRSVATSSLAGVAYNFDVAAIGASAFVLRGRGAGRSADVLRFERGTVIASVQTVKNAHAIAAVGDHVAVLAWTPQAVVLHWLDSTLASLGTPETIATAEPPSWIRYATLHAADEGRIAVSYLVGSAGDLIKMPGGRSEPGAGVRHFLGRYDASSHALADVAELQPAGTAWIAGAWLGERLFFVHGTTSAALSIFELRPPSPTSVS